MSKKNSKSSSKKPLLVTKKESPKSGIKTSVKKEISTAKKGTVAKKAIVEKEKAKGNGLLKAKETKLPVKGKKETIAKVKPKVSPQNKVKKDPIKTLKPTKTVVRKEEIQNTAIKAVKVSEKISKVEAPKSNGKQAAAQKTETGKSKTTPARPTKAEVETKSSPAPVKTETKKTNLEAKNKEISTPTIKSEAIPAKTPVSEPANRFEIEYLIHASPQILYDFLTSPSGLSEWFCDDVNIRNQVYAFEWDKSIQEAKLIKYQPDKLVRFQWTDRTDGAYFEFRIEKDELTGEIALIVVDFADTPDERHSTKLLWDSQIHKLMKILGSYF